MTIGKLGEQVTYQLPENDKRETDNLLLIPDGYRKIIVSGNPMDAGIIDGIEIIPVIDFLSEVK